VQVLNAAGRDLMFVAVQQQVTLCYAVLWVAALLFNCACQDYATAHTSIIDAIAKEACVQQVSWYACTAAGNDMAAVVIASNLSRGCLALKIDDADSSFYAAAFLMNANEAAGHISIELSHHVLNNTFFLVCVSPIMQVAHPQDVTCIRRGVFFLWGLLDALAVAKRTICRIEAVKDLDEVNGTQAHTRRVVFCSAAAAAACARRLYSVNRNHSTCLLSGDDAYVIAAEMQSKARMPPPSPFR
jgi:hypothetical protein